ncbi:hypothetical protein SCP_0208460 [Sparassis crispa]|uniref:Uncharacterized protein n=1 Tax=Sparassis crispa TaxID=139825 RepID=A0A401GBS8_9APHY|nr:hypothetical protein SCP_0208460 [Sparassis crispa]GBE79646.1 hypothetical protein SCP_0208460 [Sparassis crispa]
MHQEKSTSSGGNSNGDQSGIRSSSPTPPFETPPTSPNTPSVPDVAQFSLSVAFSSSQVQASSSLTFSVFEAPSVPVPAPVYSPNRPRSCGAHPEQWGANGECTSVKYLQSPTHRSPPVTPNILELVAVVRNERKPLALTTRPLNVTSKPKIAISPPSLSISPHVLGRQKRVQQQRRKSCSPTIGPSPLRNAVVLDSTSFTASVSTPTMGTVIKMENSLSGSTSGTWQLEDLVRDGQLDVDAVSAVLGLGLMMGSDDGDADARIITSTLDAEVGHYDQIMTGYYDDAEKSLNMGWGRARELGASLQIRVPGSQLFAIPEETDDECASARVSAASACDIDLRLLGLEQEQLDLGDEALWENVWEEEQSWTESVSIRESIGLAW